MQEAWYLFEERAIRRAAGNPNGTMRLDLPRTDELEKVPDPKKILFDLLREASGLHGRRRKKFSTIGSARRVAELLDDFSPLRALSAFVALEARGSRVVSDQGWNRRDEARRPDPDHFGSCLASAADPPPSRLGRGGLLGYSPRVRPVPASLQRRNCTLLESPRP
jgi:hypothetical protein